MLAKSMKAGFPKGVKLPADLKALCEFADENDGEVSGNFEFVTDGQFCATAWFDGDPEPAAQFAVFGQAGSGSLYALWLHSGSDAEIAPVVYLDSEGVGSKVIASTFRDFLLLLAIGYTDVGRYPTLKPDDAKSAVALRKWLKAEFGLVPPKLGTKIVADAQANHPDLGKWIEAWSAKHFATK